MSEPINLAIYKKFHKIFQVSINPDLAMEFKKGKEVDISDVLKVQQIFSDAKKGNIAREDDLTEIFGTSDVLEVAQIIIQKGEVQISASYRTKIREQKKRQIIDKINKNSINPKTKLPHPITRIESAFDEINIRIDDRKSVDEQLEDIMKQLRKVLPIRFETKKIEIVIPAVYAAKAYSQIKVIGTKLQETWQNDGSLMIITEIPAGIELEVYDKINSLTQGQALVKVIN